jgi:hypothetical protein
MTSKLILAMILSATAVWGQSTGSDPQTPQTQPERGGRMRQGSFRGTAGTITEINGDKITLKDMRGTTATIKVTPSTQYRRDRQPAKFADFKVGDMVVVRGESTGENAWTAQGIMLNAGGGAMREQLGKKFIAGEVTKIEDTKLTIKRIDGETQVIEVDENTSFRNGQRESITLADIKIGDRVAGRGDLKDGTFVPAVLNVGAPGEMMMRRPGGPGGAQGPGNDKQPE